MSGPGGNRDGGLSPGTRRLVDEVREQVRGTATAEDLRLLADRAAAASTGNTLAAEEVTLLFDTAMERIFEVNNLMSRLGSLSGDKEGE